jgi:hypothetical protein
MLLGGIGSYREILWVVKEDSCICVSRNFRRLTHALAGSRGNKDKCSITKLSQIKNCDDVVNVGVSIDSSCSLFILLGYISLNRR